MCWKVMIILSAVTMVANVCPKDAKHATKVQKKCSGLPVPLLRVRSHQTMFANVVNVTCIPRGATSPAKTKIIKVECFILVATTQLGRLRSAVKGKARKSLKLATQRRLLLAPSSVHLIMPSALCPCDIC